MHQKVLGSYLSLNLTQHSQDYQSKLSKGTWREINRANKLQCKQTAGVNKLQQTSLVLITN